jgi:hypothetical protein
MQSAILSLTVLRLSIRPITATPGIYCILNVSLETVPVHHCFSHQSTRQGTSAGTSLSFWFINHTENLHDYFVKNHKYRFVSLISQTYSCHFELWTLNLLSLKLLKFIKLSWFQYMNGGFIAELFLYPAWKLANSRQVRIWLNKMKWTPFCVVPQKYINVFKVAASSRSEQLCRWNKRGRKGHRLFYQSDSLHRPSQTHGN